MKTGIIQKGGCSGAAGKAEHWVQSLTSTRAEKADQRVVAVEQWSAIIPYRADRSQVDDNGADAVKLRTDVPKHASLRGA